MLIAFWFIWFQSPSTIVVGVDSPSLGEALELAGDGDQIQLPKGLYTGSFTVSKSISISGGGEIRGPGHGTVLILDAPNITLSGITVSGSGRDLRGPDCGIYLTPRATDSRIENCTVTDSGFGIWVHQTRGVALTGNRVIGETTGNPSNRGNGIHLFDGTDLTIRDNHISGGRDGIYVSVTEESRIEHNYLHDLRFGVHYMYSDHNHIANNTSENNVMGYALMQSKHISAIANVARNNERDGLLFRDAQFCIIDGNILEHNGEGMFFFSSTDNRITSNRLLHNKVGVKIWAGSLRNIVQDNSFVGNGRQVFYVSTQDLTWGEGTKGNYWSDYMGWDQDGDGIGDRPYRVNNFTNNLVYKYPAAQLLLRSPTLEIMALLEKKLPVFRAPTIIDLQPEMKDSE